MRDHEGRNVSSGLFPCSNGRIHGEGAVAFFDCWNTCIVFQAWCVIMDESAIANNFCLLRIFPRHTMLTASLFHTWNTYQRHHQLNKHWQVRTFIVRLLNPRLFLQTAPCKTDYILLSKHAAWNRFKIDSTWNLVYYCFNLQMPFDSLQ